MEDVDARLTGGEVASSFLSLKQGFARISAKLAALFNAANEQPAGMRALPRRVAIIGGGYAGMAAAVELAARGISICVFEAGPTLGGRARRIHYRGIDLDNGAHILLGAYRETLRLMRLVEVSDDALLRIPLQLLVKDRLAFRAARLPAPLHLLVGLLHATGASVRERCAAIRFMRAMRHARFQLPADTTVAALLATYDEQGSLNTHLWEPLCLAALNTPPGKASAQLFLNVLRGSLAHGSEDSNLLLPRVDLSRLFPEAAAQYVRRHGGEVRLLAPVSRIESKAQGYSVLSSNGSENVDAVICAVGPHQAARLIAPFEQMAHAVSLLEQFSYQPICTVYLQYAHPVSLPSAMLGLADGVVQWLFDRAALYGQPGLLCAVMSASAAHQALDNEAIAATVEEEIACHFPHFGRPAWTKVVMEKFATYACTPNLERPQQQTPVKGLYLAGDYTLGDYPATLEGAVLSGVKCAHLIATKKT